MWLVGEEWWRECLKAMLNDDLNSELLRFGGAPPSGKIKINVNGTFQSENDQGGIGVIVRNENGVCMVALSRHIPYANSAIHMEAEACRAGLLIAIH